MQKDDSLSWFPRSCLIPASSHFTCSARLSFLLFFYFVQAYFSLKTLPKVLR